MKDTWIKAWQILNRNSNILREVIRAAEVVAADLSDNADNRRHGNYVLIEEHRIRRLVAAVNALDDIDIQSSSNPD